VDNGGTTSRIDRAQLHPRQVRHLEDLKTQIVRCLEMEMKFQAEERQERACNLGIDLTSEP
jgi:hypothetical protein